MRICSCLPAVLLVFAAGAYGQEIRWQPVGATCNYAIVDNEGSVGVPSTIRLVHGNVEVTLEIHLSGWGSAPGNPDLSSYAGTVDSSGYGNGVGDPLSPKSWPADPAQGCFIDRYHPDFVPFGGSVIAAVSTATIDYEWGATCIGSGCAAGDGGDIYYGGTLILEIPSGAAGTYSIDWNPSTTKTFMRDQNATLIPGLVRTSVLITMVQGGKCCYHIGAGTNECVDGVTEQECLDIGGPVLYTADALCTGDIAVDCPFDCAGDGDCDDANQCTDDTCVEFVCQNDLNHDPAYCCNPDTGELILIDDGIECTEDICHADGSVSHDPFPAGWGCNDGNPCTTYDVCDGFLTCAGELPGELMIGCYIEPGPLECEFDWECDDYMPCTLDACVDFVCQRDWPEEAMIPCSDDWDPAVPTAWYCCDGVDDNCSPGDDMYGYADCAFENCPTEPWFWPWGWPWFCEDDPGSPMYGYCDCNPPGACCNRSTGDCTDYVAEGDCDYEWNQDVLCADLDPPCAAPPCPLAPELSRWNSKWEDRKYNNCYNYATNQMTWTFAQPGREGTGSGVDRTPWKHPCKNGTITPAQLSAMCNAYSTKADADPGISLISGPVDPADPNLPEGECLMALVVGCVLPYPGAPHEVPDYHWFRHNGNTSWSHKPGPQNARDEDDNADPIWDPEPLVSIPGATPYDDFCGWIKYEASQVQVRSSGLSFGLVDLPPATVQITTTGSSGIPYGWWLTDPAEIDDLVASYLTGLTETPDPDWDRARYYGFIIEAEAGVLSATTGLWTDSDEVMITVWEGTIEVATYPGTGEDVFVSWYADSLGLESFVVTEADTRLDALVPPAPHEIEKNRYIAFEPDSSESVAFRVEMTASEYFPGAVGVLGWVGEPDGNSFSRIGGTAYYSDSWPTVVHVGDCGIVPVATYAISATPDGTNFSDPVTVGTIAHPTPAFWADCVGAMEEGAWTGPNGVVNFMDISAAVKKFEGDPAAPHLTWVDIEPQEPNAVLNFADIMQIVLAFQGATYPFSNPADCP